MSSIINASKEQVDFAKRYLKPAITAAGLTQEKLADICGMPKQSIARLVHDHTKFDKKACILIFLSLKEYAKEMSEPYILNAILETIENYDEARNSYSPFNEEIDKLRRITMENKKLAKIIFELEDMHPWKEVKPYIDELHKNGQVNIDGFIFEEDDYCWLIWKPTDFGEHPEWKGEPLLKIVPKLLDSEEEILKVLEISSWQYL